MKLKQLLRSYLQTRKKLLNFSVEENEIHNENHQPLKSKNLFFRSAKLFLKGSKTKIYKHYGVICFKVEKKSSSVNLIQL